MSDALMMQNANLVTAENTHISIYYGDHKASIVGQGDLLFGMQSEFISRSVLARLQVSVCSGYDLCHPS